MGVFLFRYRFNIIVRENSLVTELSTPFAACFISTTVSSIGILFLLRINKNVKINIVCFKQQV